MDLKLGSNYAGTEVSGKVLIHGIFHFALSISHGQIIKKCRFEIHSDMLLQYSQLDLHRHNMVNIWTSDIQNLSFLCFFPKND